MQCRRCGFENMPGITTCVRCNSAMVADKINVHPPRAGWRKPFRPFFYALNRAAMWLPTFFVPFRIGIHYTKWLHALILAAVSIVPGVGHAISGRWRDLRLLMPAWISSAGWGIYFFGTDRGSFLIGLAIAIHVWIICDAGRLRELFVTWVGRLAFVLTIYVLLGFFFYAGLRDYAERNWIFGITTPSNLVSDGLRSDDFVMFIPHAYEHAKPKRGEIVFYLTDGAVDENTRIGRGGNQSIGKVLGLPGEHLRTKKGLMTVTAPDGAVTFYNIQSCDVLFDIDLTLKPDEYFFLPVGASMGQGGDRGGAENIGLIYDNMGRTTLDGILGRGTAVYHPLWDHEWMRHQPLQVVSTAATPPSPGT